MISIYWPLIRSIQSGRCSKMSDTSASTQSIILSAGNLQGWQSSSRGCWMKLWKAKDAKALSNTTTTCHWCLSLVVSIHLKILVIGKSSQIGNKGLSFNHIQHMYGTICNFGGPFGPGDRGAQSDWDQAVSSWAFGLLYHQHREQRPTCRAGTKEEGHHPRSSKAAAVGF